MLQLMAEGLPNLGLAEQTVIPVKAIESHVAHLFDTLGIEPNPSGQLRVLAVLELLRTTTGNDRWLLTEHPGPAIARRKPLCWHPECPEQRRGRLPTLRENGLCPAVPTL